MNAVDTNILIYAQDAREPSKQRIAQSLIASLEDGVLLWQVATEYLTAARKLQPLGFSYTAALANIHDLRELWTAKTSPATRRSTASNWSTRSSPSPLDRAARQAGHDPALGQHVKENRGNRSQHRAGHQPAPLKHVAVDEAGQPSRDGLL